jgi:hypothetical protein
LNEWANELKEISRLSSAVEHFLGKEEVMGSIPIVGSKKNKENALLNLLNRQEEQGFLY